MNTPTVTPSVSKLGEWRDHTVSITFRPVDSLAVTDVTLDPDPRDHAAVLRWTEEALQRLSIWRQAYLTAVLEEVQK